MHGSDQIGIGERVGAGQESATSATLRNRLL